MSAGALIGSLEGGGRFTLENGKLARLDPAAFEAVIRAVDSGLPIDANSVREKLDSALASGGFAIARAEVPIVINAGQARLSNTIARAQGADLTVGGSVDLADGTLEARLLLFGSGGAGSPLSARPEITIALRGRSTHPGAPSTLPRSPTGWHYGRSSSNRRSWTRSKAASRLRHLLLLRSIPTRDPPRTKRVRPLDHGSRIGRTGA